MNFNPDLPTGTAIAMSLLAASMWGSWFISLKYLGDYPLDGYIATLFTTSVLFVWGIGFVLDGRALSDNIGDVLANDPTRVLATLAGGIVYVLGMRFSLVVLRNIGLSLTQPIQSSVMILVGTLVSALVGGMPEGVSLGRILLACVVLTSAVSAAMLAGRFRSRALETSHEVSGMRVTMHDMWRSLGLILMGSILITAYPLALSFGLRSSTHPQGLAVLPFMALLATGAFIGAMISSGVSLTRRRQWRYVLNRSMSIHKFGIGSGLFHYGGNIIHTFATAHLSSAVSWPLGVSSGLWTQLWGLAYGEFKGSPRRAYVALFVAIVLYLIGVAIIAGTLY